MRLKWQRFSIFVMAVTVTSHARSAGPRLGWDCRIPTQARQIPRYRFIVASADTVVQAFRPQIRGFRLTGSHGLSASIFLAGLTTFILAGWTGMNVAV